MNCAGKLFDVVFPLVSRTDKIEFMQVKITHSFGIQLRGFCRLFMPAMALIK